MSCPAIRMKAKGSGYTKTPTGAGTEMNAKLNALMAERESQINQIFSPSLPVPRYIDLAIFSLVLDKYITPKAQRGLKYLEQTPDYEHLLEVVRIFLDAQDIQKYKLLEFTIPSGSIIEIAQFTIPSYGICVLHVFFNR